MTDPRDARPGDTSPGVGARAWVPDAVLTVLLVAALWGRALVGAAGGGFVLLRDAVSTPNPPLSDAALGVGSAAARAVPQDGVMWAAQRAFAAIGLPEALVLPLLVAGALALLGVAGRAWALAAVPGASFTVRAPAIALAMWNPFVVERLAQGAWSLLLSVAAVSLLPLFFLLTPHVRPRHAAGHPAWLIPLIALAAVTPTGLVMAAVVVAGSAIVSAGAGRRLAGPVAFAVPALVVSALPVAAATVLGWGAGAAGSTGAAEAGVAAFAARAEPGLATIGSLAGLGGIWNSDAVPASRSGALTPLLTLPLLVVWAAGAWLAFRRTARHRNSLAVRTALAVACAAIVIPALAATPPGQATLASMIDTLPALGILRDGQKWVGLSIPGGAVAIALVAAWIRERLDSRSKPLAATGAAALVLVPAALVPDAGTFLAREFTPVHYGGGWERVGAELSAAEQISGAPQTVLVLPAGGFRSTPLWADGRVVLDPAPRLLDATVLDTGDLAVAGQVVEGEGGAARKVQQALLEGADAAELADAGVDWVLDETTSQGDRGDSARTLDGAEKRFSDSELTLWRLPDPEDSATNTTGDADEFAPTSDGTRALALAAHAAWALALVAGTAGALLAGVGRPRR